MHGNDAAWSDRQAQEQEEREDERKVEYFHARGGEGICAELRGGLEHAPRQQDEPVQGYVQEE